MRSRMVVSSDAHFNRFKNECWIVFDIRDSKFECWIEFYIQSFRCPTFKNECYAVLSLIFDI